MLDAIHDLHFQSKLNFNTDLRYWCTDQMIVQITLSARDLSNAKLGCVVAACLKIFPVFLMVLPGMISRTLWPNDIACQTAEECLRACG